MSIFKNQKLKKRIISILGALICLLSIICHTKLLIADTSHLSPIRSVSPVVKQSKSKPKLESSDSSFKDKAGLLINPKSGTTDESGKKAFFFVKLKSKPSAAVIVSVVSQNPSEGVVSLEYLEFTESNWNQQKKVVVEGKDDFVHDGDQEYRIKIGPIKSDDPRYQSLPTNYLSFINREVEGRLTTSQRPGIRLSTTEKPVKGIKKTIDPFLIKGTPAEIKKNHLVIHPQSGSTTENGGKVQFLVKLEFEPTIIQTVYFTSSDTTEADVYPNTVTFTRDNWSKGVVVTVQGRDDRIVDGDQSYQLHIESKSGLGLGLDRLKVPEIELKNIDNDIPGFELGKYDPITTEDGGKSHIPIRLTSKPISEVEITLVSSATAEGVLAQNRFLFTGKNWNQPQTITVIGKNDFKVDDAKPYHIFLKSLKTKDPVYKELEFPDIRLANKPSKIGSQIVVSDLAPKIDGTLDNIPNTAGKVLQDSQDKALAVKELKQNSAKARILFKQIDQSTSESGGIAKLEIELSSQPTDTVTIQLTSMNLNEGTVSPSQLEFTSQNWGTGQFVTIQGVDDLFVDGDAEFNISLKALSDKDYRYSTIDLINLRFINKDNDTAQIQLRQIENKTTEDGGQAGFLVSLTSKPRSQVTVPFSSSDTSEGKPSVTKVVIEPDEWDSGKQFSAIGVNDSIADGPKQFRIVVGPAVSADDNYSGKKASLSFTNADNDSAAVIVSKVSGSTNENGKAVNLPIRLSSQPLFPVTIQLASLDENEGNPFPAKITFNKNNWKRSQVVKIIGKDDQMDDGDKEFQIRISSHGSQDSAYKTLNDQFITIVNEDNDTAGLITKLSKGVTHESGGKTSIPVVLSSQPSAEVVLEVKSHNLFEGTVVSRSLTFDGSNWNSPQSIIVEGVDDAADDGDIDYEISLAVKKSDDLRYQLLEPATIQMRNIDDDVAGFRIVKPTGKTNEDGQKVQFSISLTSMPTDSVRIPIKSSDSSEGFIAIKNLDFDKTNWDQQQVITVKGVNDKLVDGEQRYSVILGKVESLDPNYHGLNPDDVQIANEDNNLTTFFVSQVRGNSGENGSEAHFSIRLNNPPKGTISIKISNDNPREAEVSPGTIVFNSKNWDKNQKVTIRGLDDHYQDGDQPIKITIESKSETDPAYNDIPPVAIKLKNQDDDKAAIVTNILNTTSSEDGKEARFSIKLASCPRSSVVLLFNSTNPSEGILVSEHAAFHENNWNEEQIISIKGVADYKVDGNKDYSIQSIGTVSSDPLYNKLPFPEVKLINKDLDEAKFIITPETEFTDEMGGVAQIKVRLNSQPEDKVTITFYSDNTQEGVLDSSQLVFTKQNWKVDQVISATGVDDYIKDEDKKYHIVFNSSISEDKHYHGLTPDPVELKNLDNKRLIAGVMYSYVVPMNEFADEFDAAFELSFYGSYVLSMNLTLKLSYSTVTLEGTPTKRLYGDTHSVNQSLTLNALSSTFKYFVLKAPFILSFQGGVSLVNWTYESTTKTDGTQKGDGGSDFAGIIGMCFDYPIYGNLFFENTLELKQLTGGLGDRQLLNFGVGVYYPF